MSRFPVAQSVPPDAKAPRAGRDSAHGAWIVALFWLSRNVPALLAVLRPVAVALTVAGSARVRSATRMNAERIFTRRLSTPDAWRFALGVVGNFYQFVTDLGRSQRLSASDLVRSIESVEGREGYDACRALGRGCVIVTAHLGSFEVGLAGLATAEDHIHVVFKRDESHIFEEMRSGLRRTLGIREVPIDDGWDAWLRLRDALRRDEVVVMQGDRAMRGQRWLSVKFLGGHLRLPLGPARLAQLTGSPIVPVAAVRCASSGPARHHYRLQLGNPIMVGDSAASETVIDEAVRSIGSAIESMVARHPDQWLALVPVFEEDTPDAT